MLLIDGDAVGILQVFLHNGYIVSYGLLSVLTADKLRYVTHRTGTIEGVHCNEVLEYCRLQFAQVFLHTARLKLERAYGAPLLVELIGLGVVDRNIVKVNINASCHLDVSTCLLQLRQRFKSEEVHLDESCRFYHMTIILSAVGFRSLEIGVVGGRKWHMIANRVTADDETTGVYACTSHRSLQHLGIFYSVRQRLVVAHLCLLQFLGALYCIRQVHLHAVGQAVGNCLAQGVRHRYWHLLHSRHVLQRVLRCHRGVGDDMRAVLVAVFVLHPFKHLSAPVIVEVGIDIGQGDTVGVKETLEQEVVFQRVNLRYSETIGNNTTSRRTSTRSHHHTQFVAGRVDEVLHNEEVTWESHSLHDVQLELYAVKNLVGKFRVTFLCALVSEFCQIVSLELDAVYLVVSAEFLYLLLALFWRQLVLPVLVRCELIVELLLGEFLSPLLLRSERLGNGEERHDGVVVEAVCLHLVQNLDSVCHRLRNVVEHLPHLLFGLKPLLLRVKHTFRVVDILACREAQQVVVSLSILLVHEVSIVGANELDAVFMSKFYNHLVGLLLKRECLAVGPYRRVFHLMTLQL